MKFYDTIFHVFVNASKGRLKRSIWVLKENIWAKKFSMKFKLEEISQKKRKGFGCFFPIIGYVNLHFVW